MSIPCKHWKPRTGDTGVCSIGAYDGPSFGVCLQVCAKYDGPLPRPFLPPARAPLPVVELSDEQIEEEKRRLQAGGCCGSPSSE